MVKYFGLIINPTPYLLGFPRVSFPKNQFLEPTWIVVFKGFFRKADLVPSVAEENSFFFQKTVHKHFASQNPLSLWFCFLQKMMNAITVVIPVYNEEGNILRIQTALQQYMEASSLPVYGLFVNDGSKDASLSLIKEICLKDQRFGYLSFVKNAGLSAAIKAGFDHAGTFWVAYMDADLQTDPMDFLKFEPFLTSHQLVAGERQNRKDGLGKRLSSSFANWVRNSFLHDGMKDTGCPLKIFQRDFALQLPYFNGVHRFFPALTQIYGGQLKVIPVSHFPRTEGESKFNAFNRMVQPFLDTLLVHRLKKRNIRYQVLESKTIQATK